MFTGPGSHSDRSWRGEVLVLDESCRKFGVHGVIGTVRLYFATVPSVSTVCVLAPFCQLLPDVKLTAVNGFQCPKKKLSVVAGRCRVGKLSTTMKGS